MKATRHKLANVIAARVNERENSKRLAKETAAYLLSQGRSGELESLMRDVQQQRADHGIVEADAASAHPLSPQVQKDIKAQVKKMYPDAKEVILNEVINPEVVGGVSIILANERLDLSVRAKLNKLKQLTVNGAS